MKIERSLISKLYFSSEFTSQFKIYSMSRTNFLFYLGFLSPTFTMQTTAREEEGYFFNSSLPLPPSSWISRHWPGDYWKKLTQQLAAGPELGTLAKLHALEAYLNMYRPYSNAKIF